MEELGQQDMVVIPWQLTPAGLSVQLHRSDGGAIPSLQMGTVAYFQDICSHLSFCDPALSARDFGQKLCRVRVPDINSGRLDNLHGLSMISHIMCEGSVDVMNESSESEMGGCFVWIGEKGSVHAVIVAVQCGGSEDVESH